MKKFLIIIAATIYTRLIFIQVYEAENSAITEENVTAFVTKYFEKKLESKPLAR